MSVDLHRQAEHFMEQADMALGAGDYAKAAADMAQVGRLETEAFKLIPIERGKTRGIIAISACSSFLQAAYHAAVAGDTVAQTSFRDTARTHIAMFLSLGGFSPAMSLPDWALVSLGTLEADTDAEHAAKERRRVAT